MDYEQLTDEQLVEKAQEGDDYAFTVLFKRFEGALRYHARQSASRYPFTEEDFFEYFQERFQDIVKKFDFRGTIYFATFFKVMAPKFTNEYVRNKLRKRVLDEEGVRRRTEKPSKLAISKSNETAAPIEDVAQLNNASSTLTYDYQTSEYSTDLFKYLKSKNEKYAEIVSMLSEGYSYVEVAEKFGREGTPNSKKLWTTRMLEHIREETIYFYLKSGSFDEVLEYIS